jgi:hypothetical protein
MCVLWCMCVCVWMCACLCVCVVCVREREVVARHCKTKRAYNALRSCGKANKLGGPDKLDLSNELTNIHI